VLSSKDEKDDGNLGSNAIGHNKRNQNMEQEEEEEEDTRFLVYVVTTTLIIINYFI
jgi:hypothetical protein